MLASTGRRQCRDLASSPPGSRGLGPVTLLHLAHLLLKACCGGGPPLLLWSLKDPVRADGESEGRTVLPVHIFIYFYKLHQVFYVTHELQ